MEHTCTTYGLEKLDTDTGEAAFCQGLGSVPICSGIDVEGKPVDNSGNNNNNTTEPGTGTTTVTVTGPTTTVTVPSTSTVTESSSVTVSITTTSTLTITDGEPSTTTVTSIQPTTTTVTVPLEATPSLTISPISVTVTASFNEPEYSYAVTETITLTRHATETVDPPNTTRKPPACEPASCIGKTAGRYAHQECDCQLHYSCFPSPTDESVLVLRKYRCPGKGIYDPETKKCTSDRSVCPF